MRRFGFGPVNDKVRRVAAAEWLLLHPRFYSHTSVTHASSSSSSSWSHAGSKYHSSWYGYGALAAFGMMGLGLEMMGSRYSPSRMLVQAANSNMAFGLASIMVQNHLRYHQFTLFEENRNPNTQKRRIFFMGGKSDDIERVFSQGKSPLVLGESGHVMAPGIVDVTLHPEQTEKPGTCVGLTGLTAELAALPTEVVFLTVPTESKVACTALHAALDTDYSSDDQFVAAGLKSSEIFAALHRDPETGAFSRVTINPAFNKGDLADLEIDFQMEKICDLFPGPLRAQLLLSLNPNIDYVDFYRYKLASCRVGHAAGVAARRIYLGDVENEASERMIRMVDEEGYPSIFLNARRQQGDSDIEMIRANDGRVFVRFRGELGEQRGGNEGGLFMDNYNHACYLKYGPRKKMVRTDEEIEAGVSVFSDDPARMNESRFRNEVMMAKLYRLAGIRVPRTELFYFTAKEGEEYVGIASKYERNLVRYNSFTDAKGVYQEGWENNKFFHSELMRGAFFDFLFGNYDVIGLGYDNTLGILFRKMLCPIRIDVGAGFIFRAKGTPQRLDETADDFLTPELEPGNWFKWYEGSFGACYEELLKNYQMLSDALSFFKKVPPESIASIIRENGYSDAELTEQVIEVTLKRREALIERAEKLCEKMYYAGVVKELKNTRKKFEDRSPGDLSHLSVSPRSPNSSSDVMPSTVPKSPLSPAPLSPDVSSIVSKKRSGSLSVGPSPLLRRDAFRFRSSVAATQQMNEVRSIGKDVERAMQKRHSVSLRAELRRKASEQLERTLSFRIDPNNRHAETVTTVDNVEAATTVGHANTGIDYAALEAFVAFQGEGSPKMREEEAKQPGEMPGFGDCVPSEGGASPDALKKRAAVQRRGKMFDFGEALNSGSDSSDSSDSDEDKEDESDKRDRRLSIDSEVSDRADQEEVVLDADEKEEDESDKRDRRLSIDSEGSDRADQEEVALDADEKKEKESTADLIDKVLEESRERYWVGFFRSHSVDLESLFPRCASEGGQSSEKHFQV